MSLVFEKLSEAQVLAAYLGGFSILVGLLFFNMPQISYFIIAFSISIPLFFIAAYKMLLNNKGINKA